MLDVWLLHDLPLPCLILALVATLLVLSQCLQAKLLACPSLCPVFLLALLLLGHFLTATSEVEAGRWPGAAPCLPHIAGMRAAAPTKGMPQEPEECLAQPIAQSLQHIRMQAGAQQPKSAVAKAVWPAWHCKGAPASWQPSGHSRSHRSELTCPMPGRSSPVGWPRAAQPGG